MKQRCKACCHFRGYTIYAKRTSSEREKWHTKTTRSQPPEQHVLRLKVRKFLFGRHLRAQVEELDEKIVGSKSKGVFFVIVCISLYEQKKRPYGSSWTLDVPNSLFLNILLSQHRCALSGCQCRTAATPRHAYVIGIVGAR